MKKLPRKRDFTLDEHKFLGACIGLARIASTDLWMNCQKYYGKSNKISRSAGNVYQAIDALRSELDNKADAYYPVHRLLFGEVTARHQSRPVGLLRGFFAGAKAVTVFLKAQTQTEIDTPARDRLKNPYFDDFNLNDLNLEADLKEFSRIVDKILDSLTEYTNNLNPQNRNISTQIVPPSRWGDEYSQIIKQNQVKG